MTVPGSVVQKDALITNFINEVMIYNRNQIQKERSTSPSLNPVAAFTKAGLRADGSSVEISGNSDDILGPRMEEVPTNFVNFTSLGGAITAAALGAVFQSFAYNITRYRRVQFTVIGTDGQSTANLGTFRTALNSNYRMPISTFRAAVNASPGIVNLAPGNPAAATALNALINTLKTTVFNYMNSGAVVTIQACHNSCHSSCHGSRNRR